MKPLLRWLPLLLLTGCAAISRDCSSCGASNFGSDWIVLQYKMDGEPINCWKLKNTAITNEEHTDGIYWQGPSGHLVHISGWYNRVQVQGGDWEGAAKTLGVTMARCDDGKYAALPPAPAATLDVASIPAPIPVDGGTKHK